LYIFKTLFQQYVRFWTQLTEASVACSFLYTVTQKTSNLFGKSVTEKVRNQIMLCFPPHLSSALPCDIGNPEDSALVHACNTVQLLQRSQLRLSWTMSPTAPSWTWTHWLQDLGIHIAVWVWVVSQKDWGNQAAGWIQAMRLSCFPDLPGSAEAQVTWGG